MNRIGTPLVVGGSTGDGIVGSGRRKPKHCVAAFVIGGVDCSRLRVAEDWDLINPIVDDVGVELRD